MNFDVITPKDEQIIEMRDSNPLCKVFRSSSRPDFRYLPNEELRDFGKSTIERAIKDEVGTRRIVSHGNKQQFTDVVALCGASQGWCLEFRSGITPFGRLHKVNYQREFPVFKMMDIFNRRVGHDECLNGLLHKVRRLGL